MNFKEWLKPRVLISGGVGLTLASLIGSLLLTKSLASIPCRTTSSELYIDLFDTTTQFSTPVCVGQEVIWRSPTQVTVKFTNNDCVNDLKYPLSQRCGASWCSTKTQVKQPGSFFSSEYGKCDYTVSGGLVDPRIIIIGK